MFHDPAAPRDDESQNVAGASQPKAERHDLEELLLRAAARDDEAWVALQRRFEPRIRAVARSHRLHGHDVEDVVQTTWLELVRYIGRIREPAKLGAWLQCTARRESTRKAVAARREYLLEEMPAGPAEPPEADARLEAAERRSALSKALHSLPGRQRALMQMLYTEREPSYAEVSSALGMPIGSIGPTRARCLERLRGDQLLVSVVGA